MKIRLVILLLTSLFLIGSLSAQEKEFKVSEGKLLTIEDNYTAIPDYLFDLFDIRLTDNRDFVGSNSATTKRLTFKLKGSLPQNTVVTIKNLRLDTTLVKVYLREANIRQFNIRNSNIHSLNIFGSTIQKINIESSPFENINTNGNTISDFYFNKNTVDQKFRVNDNTFTERFQLNSKCNITHIVGNKFQNRYTSLNTTLKNGNSELILNGNYFGSDETKTNTRIKVVVQDTFPKLTLSGNTVFGTLNFDAEGSKSQSIVSDKMMLITNNELHEDYFYTGLLPSEIYTKGNIFHNSKLDLRNTYFPTGKVTLDLSNINPENISLPPNIFKFAIRTAENGFRDLSEKRQWKILKNRYDALFLKYIDYNRKNGNIALTEDMELQYKKRVHFNVKSSFWEGLGYLFQKGWWNYGYNKEYIFFWTVVLFLFFTLLNYRFLDPLINNVYRPRDLLKQMEKEIDLTNDLKQWGLLRLKYAFFYTVHIYFGLKLNISHFRHTHFWGTIYIYFIYVVGITCLAFIVNYIVISH